LRFSTLSGYLIPFLIGAAIWYLVLLISAPCLPCTEKTLEYLFLTAFCLILVYSGSQIAWMMFPERKNHALFVLSWRKRNVGSGAGSKSCSVSHKVQFIFTHSKKVVTW
jgi:hypothetical protein